MREVQNSKFKIAAVVVTYNRLELLKKCLNSLRNQSRKPDTIIVVNNGCTDGTTEWLKVQQELEIIEQENLGSSGGQYAGIEKALQMNSDWIWCMDDDTSCTETALEELLNFIKRKSVEENIGFVYPKVLWKDGNLHNMNLPGYFYKRNKWEFIGEKNMQKEFHPVDAVSFVGVMLNAAAVKEVGLPLKEIFIWYDDVEYTIRFKGYKNYYVSNSVLNHNTASNDSVELIDIKEKISFKQAYGIRNFSYLYWRNNKKYLVEFITKGLMKNFLKYKRFSSRVFKDVLSYVMKGIKADLKKIEI